MRARVLKIKKSTWLNISLAVNVLLLVTVSVLFCLFLENYNLWFFIFCFFVGLHLINKSLLFKFDSSCYFGVLLLLIGGLYILSFYYQILNFYTVFIVLSFSFASFCAYSFFTMLHREFICLRKSVVPYAIYMVDTFCNRLFNILLTPPLIVVVTFY